MTNFAVVPVTRVRTRPPMPNGLATLPTVADPGVANVNVRAYGNQIEPSTDVPTPADQAAFDEGAAQFVPPVQKVPPYPTPHPMPTPADYAMSATFADALTNLPVRHELSFPAHSVLVDNYTSQWLFVPAARRWVMPWVTGLILPLAVETSIGDISVGSPGGLAQLASVGTYVSHTWYAAMLPPCPGTPIQAGSLSFDALGALNVNPGQLSSNFDSVLARAGQCATVNVQGGSTVTSSVVLLSYTVPSNNYAYAPEVSIFNIAGTVPVMRYRYTPNAGVAEILDQVLLVAPSTTAPAGTRNAFQVMLYMAAGDVLDWFVSTGGAGSTANAYISVQQTAIS